MICLDRLGTSDWYTDGELWFHRDFYGRLSIGAHSVSQALRDIRYERNLAARKIGFSEIPSAVLMKVGRNKSGWPL